MKKKIGIGSLALVLHILGMLWGREWPNGVCIGDNILTSLNIPTWSNNAIQRGTHYTVLYCLLFWIPAIIIGHKHKDDLFANLGKWLSILFVVPMVLLLLFSH